MSNPICRLIGHKLQPRYSYGPPTVGAFEMSCTTAGEVAKIRNSGREQKYHFDICRRCGYRVMK